MIPPCICLSIIFNRYQIKECRSNVTLQRCYYFYRPITGRSNSSKIHWPLYNWTACSYYFELWEVSDSKMASARKNCVLLLMVYSTDRDLYWIADAGFVNIRRKNENKALDLQNNFNDKHDIHVCNWNIKNRYRSEFSKQFEGYFISVLLMHVCVAKTKNGRRIISITPSVVAPMRTRTQFSVILVLTLDCGVVRKKCHHFAEQNGGNLAPCSHGSNRW